MENRSWLRFGLLFLLANACAEAPHDVITEKIEPETGTVRFELMQAPPDVRCLEVRVKVETLDLVTKLIATGPGQPTGQVTLGALPLGPATLTAAAHNLACNKVGSATATWMSDPITAIITANPPLDVTFVMRKVGQARATFDFQDTPVPPQLGTAFAIDADGKLVQFQLHTPQQRQISLPLHGLAPGEEIFAIDVRPRDKALYGLGSSSRLYRIDTTTGFALAVGPPFSPTLEGTSFGLDFNPSVDRLRVTSETGQNLRLHPDTGAVVAVDVPIMQAGTPLTGLAYDNNLPGAPTSTLYALSALTQTLYFSPVPNVGQLTPLGLTGISEASAFDIAGPNDDAYAVAFTTLYRIDLATGASTSQGTIGGGVEIVAFALGL